MRRSWLTRRCALAAMRCPRYGPARSPRSPASISEIMLPASTRAFQAALDTRTIGERLQVPGKPDSVILGPVWFYYGARYGDYLAGAGSSEAEAWLPASLEASPGNPDAYLALGDCLRRGPPTGESDRRIRTCAGARFRSRRCARSRRLRAVVRGPSRGGDRALELRVRHLPADSESRRTRPGALLEPRGAYVHRHRRAPCHRPVAS